MIGRPGGLKTKTLISRSHAQVYYELVGSQSGRRWSRMALNELQGCGFEG